MRSYVTERCLPVFIAALVGIAFVAVTADAESPRKELEITFALTLTGEESAEGSFQLYLDGALVDEGIAEETFRLSQADGLGRAPRTVHGVKNLQGGNGKITIRFHARVTPTSDTTFTAEGRFVILGGTGSYKNVHGAGTTVAGVDLAASEIKGSYTGHAQYDKGHRRRPKL